MPINTFQDLITCILEIVDGDYPLIGSAIHNITEGYSIPKDERTITKKQYEALKFLNRYIKLERFDIWEKNRAFVKTFSFTNEIGCKFYFDVDGWWGYTPYYTTALVSQCWPAGTTTIQCDPNDPSKMIYIDSPWKFKPL